MYQRELNLAAEGTGLLQMQLVTCSTWLFTRLLHGMRCCASCDTYIQPTCIVRYTSAAGLSMCTVMYPTSSCTACCCCCRLLSASYCWCCLGGATYTGTSAKDLMGAWLLLGLLLLLLLLLVWLLLSVAVPGVPGGCTGP
jgi:hypothetical protein